MSVISGLNKSDFKTASDGLLELSEERLRSIMRSEPISTVYHVEQTPFARGKFASVRKIRHLVTGVEYAAKFIRKRRRAADTTREIQHEVAVLALCGGCSRVVKLHEVYETTSEVAIVLELCVGGELQRVLEDEERLTEGAARRALRHVLEGLQHLHARRVAHLDLKPQNLLLSEDGAELVICDFGISRAIQPGAHVREILGTIDYVAPEILSYEPLSLAADVWSVGVLAYVLLSGYSPFAGDTKQETFLNIARCHLTFDRDLFRGVSTAAMAFIEETLIVDPNGRLTVDECLEHPWLKDEVEISRAIVGVGYQQIEDLTDSESDDNDVTHRNGDVTHCNGDDRGDVKHTNGVGGHSNGDLVNSNGELGKSNGDVSHSNGDVSHSNGDLTHCNGHHKTKRAHANGDDSPVQCNGVNGTHDTDNDRVCSESSTSSECAESIAQQARDAKPFPDAPSTPKVSRKCHQPPSVLALCKKFQPDYEKPARNHHTDRAVLC